MKTIVLAAAVGVIASISAVHAEGLSKKIMNDHPGVSGGQTATPTARPDNNAGGLQRKAMQDHPGTKGGSTVAPLANSDTGSIKERITER